MGTSCLSDPAMAVFRYQESPNRRKPKSRKLLIICCIDSSVIAAMPDIGAWGKTIGLLRTCEAVMFAPACRFRLTGTCPLVFLADKDWGEADVVSSQMTFKRTPRFYAISLTRD